jgi:hypothetical protein
MSPFVISRVFCVTGFPWPVVASWPWKTELMSVLFPTPVRPAMRTLTCPRSRRALWNASLGQHADVDVVVRGRLLFLDVVVQG